MKRAATLASVVVLILCGCGQQAEEEKSEKKSTREPKEKAVIGGYMPCPWRPTSRRPPKKPPPR